MTWSRTLGDEKGKNCVKNSAGSLGQVLMPLIVTIITRELTGKTESVPCPFTARYPQAPFLSICEKNGSGVGGFNEWNFDFEELVVFVLKKFSVTTTKRGLQVAHREL